MIVTWVRAAACVALFAVSSSLAAVGRLVTVDGVDAGDCSDTPCATLSYAIAQASDPDLISVGPGTFTNGGAVVNVNKHLRLEGAQAGVDARGRVGAESILTVPVVLAVDSITIIGFTIDCGACAPVGAGIAASAAPGFHSIFGNIVTGNPVGVRFDAVSLLLLQNHITENNNGVGVLPGAGTGVSMTGAQNFDVRDNWISHHQTTNLSLTDVPDFSGHIGVNVFTQDVVDDGSSIVLTRTSGVVIENNVLTGGTAPMILVGDGNDGLVIAYNSLTGSAAGAIAIAGSSAEPNGEVVIHANNVANNLVGIDVTTSPPATPLAVHYNRLEDNGTDVRVSIAGLTIDGDSNWWGCNEGPAACAASAIAAGSTTDLDPWLVLTIDAFPDSIATGQTSIVIAGFTGPYFPEGIPVSFTASGGTMNPTTGLTPAFDSIFSPTAPGIATVYATVDDETVAAAIVVAGAPAVPALSGFLLMLLAASLAVIALAALRPLQ